MASTWTFKIHHLYMYSTNDKVRFKTAREEFCKEAMGCVTI